MKCQQQNQLLGDIKPMPRAYSASCSSVMEQVRFNRSAAYYARYARVIHSRRVETYNTSISITVVLASSDNTCD